MYPGLACQIHAGYMQDTCGIHAQRTYLLAACGYMQDTCKTCKIQGSSVYLGTADKIHAGYMQDACRIHVGYEDQVCILAQPFRYVADMRDMCGNRMCRCIPSPVWRSGGKEG